jgi:mannitol/fructose-specific phosphotransferase system IIA component (Ntr-type)
MNLADFTDLQLMIPSLQGEDTASVIHELSKALQREKRVPDLLPFYQEALNHEFLVSSDMETGVAFPNARVPSLKKVCYAVGRSNAPLRWGIKGSHLVRLVFLLAVPATDATQYLQVVSGIARLSQECELMARLQNAANAADMLEVLHSLSLAPAQVKSR